MITGTLKKILIVEDDKDIQEIARLSLETIGGFTLKICSSGRAAIDEAPLFNPDLILLDVMMPGMDGLTTLKELKKIDNTKTIPVVFMTAKVQSHEIQLYKEAGAIDVISKPFDPMTLAETINKMWAKIL